MSVEIDGIKTVDTLSGPTTVTIKGIAIPTQIRMNMEDPTLNIGEIRFYQKCYVPTNPQNPREGHILHAVRGEFQVRIEAVPDDGIFTIAENETLTGREIKLAMKAIFLHYSELNERPLVVEPILPVGEE
jgi:hypothetical protein